MIDFEPNKIPVNSKSSPVGPKLIGKFETFITIPKIQIHTFDK